MNLFFARMMSCDLSLKETLGVVASVVGIIAGIYTVFLSASEENVDNSIHITNHNDNSNTDIGEIGDDEFNISIAKNVATEHEFKHYGLAERTANLMLVQANDACILLQKSEEADSFVDMRLVNGLQSLPADSDEAGQCFQS